MLALCKALSPVLMQTFLINPHIISAENTIIIPEDRVPVQSFEVMQLAQQQSQAALKCNPDHRSWESTAKLRCAGQGEGASLTQRCWACPEE